MGEQHKCTLAELPGKIEEHVRQLRRDTDEAIQQTVVESIPRIRHRTPRAFGELVDSTHAILGENPKIVLDAPHAAAVEIGSMPHMPDIEKLVAWVKLRGMQSLHKRRQLARLGPTTPQQAVRVGEMLSARVVRANALGKGHGEFTPVDAVHEVAMAIARGIEKNGTRPHWMVRSSLDDIRTILHRRVRGALKK